MGGDATPSEPLPRVSTSGIPDGGEVSVLGSAPGKASGVGREGEAVADCSETIPGRKRRVAQRFHERTKRRNSGLDARGGGEAYSDLPSTCRAGGLLLRGGGTLKVKASVVV